MPKQRQGAKGKSGSKGGAKASLKRTKMNVSFGAQGFRIQGRPQFASGAKRIRVNQNASNGPLEDRRHVLHYDEVLKPLVEQVITALYRAKGCSIGLVAGIVRRCLHKRGVMRLPKGDNEVLVRLVVEMNSVRANLVPGRADTNKAIEVVRGYLRKYIQQLSTDEFAKACGEEGSGQMKPWIKLAHDIFVRDDRAVSDISAERNRMHEQIIGFIEGCASPSDLWVLIHELVHSVTFDFSPNISPAETKKANEWQRMMMRVSGDQPEEQLEALLSLMN